MFITNGCENKSTKLPEPTKSLHKASADGDSNQFKLLIHRENQESPYLKAVHEFADNVLKYGRDTYGPRHTPLFVDGLNIHTHEPVKWIAPDSTKWILSNLASQQNLFRTLDGLSTITGEPKYKQAAMEAIEYAFANLRSPNGLLYWGGHVAYDTQADEICFGGKGYYHHELKWHFPYYELMWQVDSKATKQFIESFWSAHILDWSNLDMNRHGSMDEQLESAWNHNYEGDPVFFESIFPFGLSFSNTGSDLFYAGSMLYKLLGDKEALLWSKRLAYRYIETRDPEIGISGIQYSRSKVDRAQAQFGDDFKGHLVLDGTIFPMGPASVALALQARTWICQLILGDMLGPDGAEFSQWALEELTALGKVAYHKEDNSFIPMLTDGTSLVGYAFTKDGYYGPKGTVFPTMGAGHMCFWAYALAYRVTGDPFMWDMARSIARGNNLGDIGASSMDEPKLETDIDCSDPHVLLGFLELYVRLQKKQFLKIASRIGDNILSDRSHMGFFVPSKEALYAKFDYVEPLALLRLDTAVNTKSPLVPQVWPGRSSFGCPYYGGNGVDTKVIYSQTKQTELPMLLRVAAGAGKVTKVETLISKGADVNVHFKFDSRIFHRILGAMEDFDIGIESSFANTTTSLHYAAEKGHTEIAELLIANGADVNAKNIARHTPLHYVARTGHKDIAEMLIANGADVNAKNRAGETPLHYVARTGRKDIAEMLIAKGADVNAKNNNGQTPLHYVAVRGLKGIAELLIAKGADVNAKNNEGQTPVDIAASRNRSEVVKLLVEKGADVSNIHLAAYLGDVAKVMNFIEQGSDVNTKNQRGFTPLHYAARLGHKEIVEVLLANGADVNIEERSYNRTAVEFAMGRNHKEIVERLISKGADIPPLHLAIYLKDEAKARSLIKSGGDVNKRTPYGTTPLHRAVSAGFNDLAAQLIAKGADVNAKDNWNWTPLHGVAEEGHRELVELLIAKGANVNARDGGGRTPLWYAKDQGYTEIVELLSKHGAKE